MSEPLRIERMTATAARPARHAWLRPHQPPEDIVVPGDDAADTAHFGGYLGDTLVGIASVYHESREVTSGEDGWRLRMMATAPEYRGHGRGRALLEACAEHARKHGGQWLWCNARTTAEGFYLKCGFTAVGDVFEIPHIGPHVVMERPL